MEVVATQRASFEALRLLVGDLDASALRERLEQRDYLYVLYVRHFDPDICLGWREAFQTDHRAAVERYCADNDIDLAWGWARTLPLGSGDRCPRRARRPVR